MKYKYLLCLKLVFQHRIHSEVLHHVCKANYYSFLSLVQLQYITIVYYIQYTLACPVVMPSCGSEVWLLI